MPAFTRASLHDVVRVIFAHQRQARDFDFKQQRLHIARKYDVAATTQYQQPLPE